MRILIVSHAFSLFNPCGKLNQLFVETLVRTERHQIQVLSDEHATAYSSDAYSLLPLSCRPQGSARLRVWASGAWGRDLLNISWEMRARRAGSRLCREWRPDIIYSRSNPIASAMVGDYLSRKFGIPHHVYFSDPIPAPLYMEPASSLRRARHVSVEKILQHATSVSYGTRQMLAAGGAEFPELAAELRGKGYVLPNFIPRDVEFGAFHGDHPVFSYVGSFYGLRKADTLIAGFSRYLQTMPRAELRLFGCSPQRVTHLLTSDELRRQVRLLPRVTDVYSVFRDSTALIDVDPDHPDNAFSSTKIFEYLGVDRPIISITTPNSPSAQMLAAVPETIFIMPHGQPAADVFGRAVALNHDEAVFKMRRKQFCHWDLDHNIEIAERHWMPAEKNG